MGTGHKMKLLLQMLPFPPKSSAGLNQYMNAKYSKLTEDFQDIMTAWMGRGGWTANIWISKRKIIKNTTKVRRKWQIIIGPDRQTH